MQDHREPADLVEVGFYADAKKGFDHGLVAIAMGVPYWLMPAEAGFRLMVPPEQAGFVQEQLAKYDRESAGWPPRPLEAKSAHKKLELFLPLLWALAVMASFWAQGMWPAWTSNGAMDARAVFERRELWRAATALFLHGDLGHLVSNLLSGIFVFSAVLTTMGRRRGVVLLALSSITGNLLAAAMHHTTEYRSVGASTAVFAALGLLTGRAVRVMIGSAHPRRWRAMFVPMAAGLTVLALYGAGEQRVDVIAHVTGFAAGLVGGLVAGAPVAAQDERTEAVTL